MIQATQLNEIARSLSSAPSRADLIAHSQRIQNLPEHWQREQAAKIVKRKLADFKSIRQGLISR